MEALLTQALPDIDRAVRAVTHRHALSAEESDDFASEVKVTLIENDYAVLAQFRGESSLRTFLNVVVQRLFIDHRRRAWGRWHTSAVAKRLGPIAERLELMIYRDGRSTSEACQELKARLGPGSATEDLEELAHRLPVRQRVRVDAVGSAGDLSNLLPDGRAPEETNPHSLLQSEESIRRCQAAMGRALAGVSAHDRILLRLRYEDGMSVPAIARLSSQEQKELYRRLERLLKDIRASLESEGMGWSDVSQAVDAGACQFALVREPLPRGWEDPAARPSILEAKS